MRRQRATGNFWKLGLAACVAARQFVRRHKRSSYQRRMWQEILLYWRRKRKMPLELRNAWKARPNGTATCAHLHLHFSLPQMGFSHRDARPGPSKAATTVQGPRVIRSYPWTVCRATAQSMRTYMSDSLPGVYHHVVAPFRWVDLVRPIAIRFGKRLNAVPDSNGGGLPSREDRFTIKRFGRVDLTHKVEIVNSWQQRQKFARQRMNLYRDDVIQQMNTKTIRHVQTKTLFSSTIRYRAQASAKDLQPRLPESVHLVFRGPRVKVDRHEQVAEASPFTGAAMTMREERGAPGLSVEPSRSLPHPGGGKFTQGMVIDPVLLNRLTDDVIRRVEQRARIERERRGL